MPKEFDPETQKIMAEGQKVYDFVNSDAWGIIKDKLIAKIMDLQSVLNVTGTDPEQVAFDVKSRQLTCQLLYEWLKEIEGTAAQHVANNVPLTQSVESHIIYFEK